MRPAFKLNNKVNLAFSCGKDSIAFAFFLKRGWKNVHLIHVNNGLPGDDLILEKTIKFAKDFSFELTVINEAPQGGGGLEKECREARIKAFSRYDEIIVCHHLGDAVENYIKRFLTGKLECKPIHFFSVWGTTKIFRPFLLVPPKKIKSFIDTHGLQEYIAEDIHSYQSERHWMRTELIPLINQRNFNLEKRVSRILSDQLKLEKC